MRREANTSISLLKEYPFPNAIGKKNLQESVFLTVVKLKLYLQTNKSFNLTMCLPENSHHMPK